MDTTRNLAAIDPFFIVDDLRTSVTFYVQRLGFRLDFQAPAENPFFARVSATASA
jgi:catechol 2,3-dioxygenase-like lactoylglutathione lyase family enzyme